MISRAAVPTEPTPGPLVIEEYDSTTVVPPDAAVRRDAFGNLLITLTGLRMTRPGP